MGARPQKLCSLELQELFRARGRWTYREVGEQWGISREAARKRIERLHKQAPALVELVREAGEVWVCAPPSFAGGVLPPREVPALLSQLQYGPRRDGAEELLERLVAMAPERERAALRSEFVEGERLPPEQLEVLERLESAHRAHKALRLRYQKANAEQPESRVVSPQRMLPREGFKLLAWCHKQRALRLFALPRIRHAALEERVTYHPCPIEELEDFLSTRLCFGFAGSGPSVACTFELTGIASARALATLRRELPRSLELTRTERGALRGSVLLPRDALRMLAGFLVRHGEHALALTPELREEVLAIARACLLRHGAASTLTAEASDTGT